MEQEIICISCPIGCHLKVSSNDKNPLDEDKIVVENNKCARGEIYGKEEILAPKRVVTATCAVDSALMSRIPVKTDAPLAKERISALLDVLYKLELKIPLKTGTPVIQDFEGSGINIITTRSLAG